MSALVPGEAMDAAAAAVSLEPLPAEQVVSGAPSAGSVELDTLGGVPGGVEGGALSGVEIGVWEHTPGVSTDVEADEVFVVLSGSATVSFDDSVLAPVELRPGVAVRLTAGMRTTWTVHETLRKVYVTG